MKATATYIVLLILVQAACADDITLTDGTVFKNAKIVQHDDSTKTVTISFSGGIAQVHSEMVPSSLTTTPPRAAPTATTAPASLPPTASTPDAPIPKDWTVDGRQYHNVTVGDVEADRVHITYDGGLGTVPLADLPPDLQKRFNYAPSAAKAMAQQRELQAAQSDATAYAAQAQANQQQAVVQVSNSALRHAIKVFGAVRQTVPGGLMVLNIEDRAYDAVSQTDVPLAGPIGINNVFFLKNVPQQDTLVEGDRIHAIVVRDGSYTYTDTSGAPHRVAAYSYYEEVPKN